MNGSDASVTKKLAELLKDANVPIQFGLRGQKKYDTVKAMRAAGASWDAIAKEIGWTAKAVEDSFEFETPLGPWETALNQLFVKAFDITDPAYTAYTEMIVTLHRLNMDHRKLQAEVERLQAGQFTDTEVQNICHNLHGVVDAQGFATGCADEQRRLYGCAPDRDAGERLRAALQALYDDTASYILVNHLGDVHHNRAMQLAADALEIQR